MFEALQSRGQVAGQIEKKAFRCCCEVRHFLVDMMGAGLGGEEKTVFFSRGNLKDL